MRGLYHAVAMAGLCLLGCGGTSNTEMAEPEASQEDEMTLLDAQNLAAKETFEQQRAAVAAGTLRYCDPYTYWDSCGYSDGGCGSCSSNGSPRVRRHFYRRLCLVGTDCREYCDPCGEYKQACVHCK